MIFYSDEVSHVLVFQSNSQEFFEKFKQKFFFFTFYLRDQS